MAIPTAIQNNLIGAGITNAMPAWKIVDRANFLPPRPNSPTIFGDTVPAALTKLMGSFYDYGHTKPWSWVQKSPGAAAAPGLLMGKATEAACATFALNFQWLAERALEITNLTQQQTTTPFLTAAQLVGIDPAFPGNVANGPTSNVFTFCYRFSQHYWVSQGATNYDVCFNKSFANIAQMTRSTLQDPQGGLAPQGGNLYRLATPLPGGVNFLEKVSDSNGPHNWSQWRVVTQAQLHNA